MVLGIKREFKDGFHFLVGSIDEHVDLDVLAALPDPVLRFNMRGIRAVNSLGLRKLIGFSQKLGAREVEYHECTPVFVETINNVPNVIGGTKYVNRVKSVNIPMGCPQGHDEIVTIPIAKINFDKGVAIPKCLCKVCREPLIADVEMDLEDFFFFITSVIS